MKARTDEGGLYLHSSRFVANAQARRAAAFRDQDKVLSKRQSYECFRLPSLMVGNILARSWGRVIA
jgi:hypothetical protein